MSVSRTTCPSCGAGLKSSAGFNPGQAVRCPKCATPFTVPEPGFEEVDDEPAPPPKKKGAPARAARGRDDDDDDRPRRRSRDDDDDDDDDRPRKKKKTKYQEYKSSPVRFAILGVLLVVLGVLAFLLYQKKMREREDAEGPAPEGGNQQVAPPIRGGGGRQDLNQGGGRPLGNGPDAAAAGRGMESMKKLMRAMHSHNDLRDRLPNAAITDPTGKALLSWRVSLLPLLGHDALYKQFKLDEPWDSPANRPLLVQMPAVFQGTLPTNDGKTAFKVFVGNGAVFELRRSRSVMTISDGTSNTLAIVESGPPVEWTRPDDIPFDGKTPPRLEAPTGGNTIVAALADGRVIQLNVQATTADTLRRLIHASDGEVVQVP